MSSKSENTVLHNINVQSYTSLPTTCTVMQTNVKKNIQDYEILLKLIHSLFLNRAVLVLNDCVFNLNFSTYVIINIQNCNQLETGKIKILFNDNCPPLDFGVAIDHPHGSVAGILLKLAIDINNKAITLLPTTRGVVIFDAGKIVGINTPKSLPAS